MLETTFKLSVNLKYKTLLSVIKPKFYKKFDGFDTEVLNWIFDMP